MSRNLLGHETSPYLLQHRDNPVHWRPWGVEAMLAAKRDNKPILLSIGYSACHWCHVMAHESFEDADTALQLNADFIAVKVDREERPDVDMLYQSALSLLGQHGGWPLTMFLTPDALPFWGGTYFPKRSRFGLPAFRDVLNRISQTYRTQFEKVTASANLLNARLQATHDAPADPPPDHTRIDSLRAAVLRMVDTVDGGLFGAPKFPHVPVFTSLWQAAMAGGTHADAARTAVLTTLDHLCQGGIYDHLAGGFARYSTDEFWLVPHFEKMLYDNAQLIGLLTLVWQETRSPLYERRVAETVAWLNRDMMTEDGAFAASLDADTDGAEGRYYVWSTAEIDYLLAPPVARRIQEIYGMVNTGNWEGSNILHRNHALGHFDPDTEGELDVARASLLAARLERTPPMRDDKILADWNGMTIAALARAAEAFRRPDWRELAVGAFRAIIKNLACPDGTLFHSRRLERHGADGLLDDYAQMARAALLLFETGAIPDGLSWALTWVEIVNRRFWDERHGAYFLAADTADDLPIRTKAIFDQATPSGNGVMAEVLARLSYLTGDETHRERVERMLSALAPSLKSHVVNMTSLLHGWEFLQSAIQIVVVGEERDATRNALRDAVADVSLPLHVLTVVSPGQSLPVGHPAKSKLDATTTATAFVCRGPVCSLPIQDPAELRRYLRSAALE